MSARNTWYLFGVAHKTRFFFFFFLGGGGGTELMLELHKRLKYPPPQPKYFKKNEFSLELKQFCEDA